MVCFFWGTTWMASKFGVMHMPALQMAGIRQLLGGTLYIIFFLARGASLPKGKEWIPIIVLSLLNFVLTNGLGTWGVRYISAGLGAIIAATFPLWIVIIDLFSGKSTPPTKAIIGLLLGFGGVCIIFYEHFHDFLNPDFRFGIIISVIAAWSWAFGTLYTKKQAKQFNPYFSIGLQMFMAGVIMNVAAEATGNSIPVANIPWQSWSAIVYLVTIGSVFSFIAYLYALQHLPTEQASIYAYINPVVAVVLGSLFFDEKMTVYIITGGLVALYGVYLINKVYKKGDSPEA
jgi:drug/metabolite transporter (DMT)-like permease